ncbi:hypothetical protein SPRG_05785 [Saprolegnia parasitica CBS 223.65]|uniref:MARVEL domain-containing protein n=1 Tax=Saprolegnia parasitica (strain CBS 223.65) TaxID=695850 RepID=A0A067CDS3_SAPPC|nr:hypothetical protein SPRG_05785 [Saprolegnia parasitica CBS 223.65]KDO28914.1 hypothetical protein SPRG_05785 [Saprolegnia parasitica CBS 223.65]|eukprot:XP_012200457.1 hypothetical protein SPRG_05785 [Saprolegnia parasitica CBS 223.65]
MTTSALLSTGARLLQAITSLATLIAVFMAFDSFMFRDNSKTYRFITVPMMATLVVSTAGFLFAASYCLFVLALDRLQPDVLVERIVDGLLAMAFALCGIFMAGLGGCSASDPSQFHCATYSATMALNFVAAVLFAFAMVYSLLTTEIPHPDAVENLVPRGNYGRASSPAHISPKADDTLTIMPRGQFGSVQPHARGHNKHDQDNTNELVPRGKFGSIV